MDTKSICLLVLSILGCVIESAESFLQNGKYIHPGAVLHRSLKQPIIQDQRNHRSALFMASLWERLEVEEDEEPMWYVLNCVAGLEMDLLAQCRQRCGDMEDVVKFVVPTVTTTRSHGANRMVQDTKVKYQGYVFAKLRLCAETYDAIQGLDLCRSWMGTINQKGLRKLPPAPVCLNEEEIENFGLETWEDEEPEELEKADDDIILDSEEEDSKDAEIEEVVKKVYMGLRVEDMIKVTAKNKFFNEDGIVRRLKDGKVLIRFYTYGTMYDEWLDPGDVRKMSNIEILKGLSGPSKPITQYDFDNSNGNGYNGDRSGYSGYNGDRSGYSGYNGDRSGYSGYNDDRSEYSGYNDDRSGYGSGRGGMGRGGRGGYDSGRGGTGRGGRGGYDGGRGDMGRGGRGGYDRSGYDSGRGDMGRGGRGGFDGGRGMGRGGRGGYDGGRGDTGRGGRGGYDGGRGDTGRSGRGSGGRYESNFPQDRRNMVGRLGGRERNRYQDRAVRQFQQNTYDDRKAEENWNWYKDNERRNEGGAYSDGDIDIRGSGPRTDWAGSDVDSQWGRSTERGPMGQRGTRGGRSNQSGGTDDWSSFVSQSAQESGQEESDDFFDSLMTELSSSLETEDASTGGSYDQSSAGSTSDADEDDFFSSLMSEISDEPGADQETSFASSPVGDRMQKRKSKTDASDELDDFFSEISEFDASDDKSAASDDEGDDFLRSLEAEIDTELSGVSKFPEKESEEESLDFFDNDETFASDDEAGDFFDSFESDVDTLDVPTKKTSTSKSPKKEQVSTESPKAASSTGGEDLSKYTVPVLKGMLKERGLKVSGKKAELIERLTAAQ